MPKRPFFRPTLLALAAALAASAGACHRPSPQNGADTGPLVVTAAHPLVDTITLFTNLTGTVEARETVEVRPRVSGYITEVKFKEGDLVKANQPLFTIDPTIYQAQLEQAQGQVANYKAQVAKAEADLGRAKEAYEKGVTSKSELDVAVANKGIAEAQLLTAQANAKQARQNLAWTTVTSAVDGRADRAYQTVGNLVTGTTTTAGGTGTVLTTVVSVDPMYAYFDVDEQTVLYYRRLIREGKISSVQKGAMVDAHLQLRGETGYPHAGSLDFISNRLNPGTGSLTIRGTFPNPDGFLIPGLFCRAKIPASRPFEALLIPPAAVLNEEGKRVVYVVGEGNRVEEREVELGPIHRGLQVIDEGVTTDEKGHRRGLSRGDLVVIRGLQRLEPGVPVEPRQEQITYPPEQKQPVGPRGGLPTAGQPATGTGPAAASSATPGKK
jgi:RND family efflux transporter MFP subunit